MYRVYLSRRFLISTYSTVVEDLLPFRIAWVGDFFSRRGGGNVSLVQSRYDLFLSTGSIFLTLATEMPHINNVPCRKPSKINSGSGVSFFFCAFSARYASLACNWFTFRILQTECVLYAHERCSYLRDGISAYILVLQQQPFLLCSDLVSVPLSLVYILVGGFGVLWVCILLLLPSF